MQLRIGINLGDVVIEGDDLFGDGVNIAARIEGLAEPGGVAISDSVHEHVRGRDRDRLRRPRRARGEEHRAAGACLGLVAGHEAPRRS